MSGDEQINYYSLICSRSNGHNKTALELFKYLGEAGVQVKNLIGYNSIFEAYSEGFKSLNAKNQDIIILCHDDISIIDPHKQFKKALQETQVYDTGFIGVAGTARLQETAVWWDWVNPQHMKGSVYHGTSETSHRTDFGPPGKVVVLDGLFLACRAELLTKIDLTKPIEFEGNWDFYDLHLTLQAYQRNFNNKVVKLQLRHESMGEITDRTSWHKNREAFMKMYKLPIKL